MSAALAVLLKAVGPLCDTDGESMAPEPYKSSGSGPDGLRVVSDHVRVDPDALGPTTVLSVGDLSAALRLETSSASW